MRKKTLWLTVSVLSALTAMATIALTQSALADHETGANSDNTTAFMTVPQMQGYLVPEAKLCTNPPPAGSSAANHAAPVVFKSCQTPGTTDSTLAAGESNSKYDVSNLLATCQTRTPALTGNCGTTSACTGAGCGSTSGFVATGNWRVKLVSAGTASVDTLVDSSGTGVICEKAQRFGSAPPETPPDPDEAIEIAQCGDDNLDGIADANGAYEGGVIGKSTIRSSDHNNCDSPCVGTNTGTEAGTVVDFDFGFPVGCTAGTCTLSSSANTLLAGSVTNGKQSSVEIISVRSLDPGPDGDIAGAACPLNCGNGNEKDFARQGLFWK